MARPQHTFTIVPVLNDPNSYLNEAVQGLQGNQVYTAIGSSVDSDAQSQLVSATSGTDIAVAALPASAASEAGDVVDFANQIAVATAHRTVIVAIGRDIEAVSSGVSQSKIDQVAATAEANNASTGDALLQAISTTKTMVGTSSASPDQVRQDGNGSNIPVIGAVLVAMILIGVIVAILYRKWQSASGSMRSELPAAKVDDSALPTEIRDRIKSIRASARSLGEPDFNMQIEQAMIDTTELFAVLKNSRSDSIHQITADYDGTLENISDALDQYSRVKLKPRYWSNSGAMLKQMHTAIDSYGSGVLMNVQEANQGTVSKFNVDVKMILSANPAQTDPFQEETK